MTLLQKFSLALVVLALAPATYAAPKAPWQKANHSPLLRIHNAQMLSPNLSAALKKACTQVAEAHVFSKEKKHWDISVHQALSAKEFYEATSLHSAFSAAALNTHLWLSSPRILAHVGDLDQVLRHECAHLWLRSNGIPPLPLALEEAVAEAFSNPSPLLQSSDCSKKTLLSFAVKRAQLHSPLAARKLYQHAYTCIWPPLSKLTDVDLSQHLRKIAASPALWLSFPLAKTGVSPFSFLTSHAGATP